MACIEVSVRYTVLNRVSPICSNVVDSCAANPDYLTYLTNDFIAEMVSPMSGAPSALDISAMSSPWHSTVLMTWSMQSNLWYGRRANLMFAASSVTHTILQREEASRPNFVTSSFNISQRVILSLFVMVARGVAH